MDMNNKMKQILLFGVAAVIAAQVSFDLLNSELKISLGILTFSAAFMLVGKYPVLPVTIFSAAGIVLTRTAALWLSTGELMPFRFIPEAVFYLVYGMLFWLYMKKTEHTLSIRSAVPLFLFDLTSNCAELFCRYPDPETGLESFIGIILVAVFRTLLILFLMYCLSYYKFSLLKLEHAERYQRLLMLNSRLNDEVILMKRNKNMIEAAMNTAYKLFKELEETGTEPLLSKKALCVAKDVHEIKKEYVLILRGLSEALDVDMQEDGMYIHDILRIIKNSLINTVAPDKELNIDLMIEKNLYTEKHYPVMSVFRNLFMNAIEASEKNTVNLSVWQTEDRDFYTFYVEDDGPGIPEENLEEIFSAGFSTKINYETGEINRGLGLSLVKDLIENQFGGSISVESKPGCTVFMIHTPKKEWRADKS